MPSGKKTGPRPAQYRQTYVRQNVDKDVLTLARERMADVFDRFDTVSVSFSGGKDSTVVLNLAADEAERRGARLNVAHYDEEAIPYETEHYVRRTMHQLHERLGDRLTFDWYCLPVKHRNACAPSSPWWYCWALEDEEKWVRPMPPEGLTEKDCPWFRRGWSIPDCDPYRFDKLRDGLVAVVMGIRAAESLTRNHAVSLKLVDNWLIPVQGAKWITKAYPIFDWQATDVWKAPAALGWDYNEAYDVMALAGLTPHQQRCAPPYGEEPLQGLWTFHTCFPEIWDKMANRVPGANTAARYSRTHLYQFGKRDDTLDPGETWPARLQAEIAKWDDDTQSQIIPAVQFYIDHHYNKTDNPILDVPHPTSGVSWPFLVKVAVRGDTKQRMRMQLQINRAAKSAATYPERLEAWHEPDSELRRQTTTLENASR